MIIVYVNELKVFKNDVTDWVVAKDAADATKAMCEFYGANYEHNEEEAGPWVALPEAETIVVNDEDLGRVEKTCAQWAADNGRGFLASTEW